MAPRVDGLERRNLMTAGSVVQSGALVSVTPASTGPNVTTVSYQAHGGTTMLDVNLNGQDNFFSLSQVGFVYYYGQGGTGPQTCQDSTSLHVVAYGGSGANAFYGGAGQDTFFGGSGCNTFYAGTGADFMIGGTGANTFYENSAGLGEIIGGGPASNNTVVGTNGSYYVYA